MEGSTLVSNTAGFVGGGISSHGSVELLNTTISGNHASTAAGGLVVEGPASLLHVTISGNSSSVATALMNSPSSSVTVGHTILSGSCNSADTVSSLGGNIESPGNGCQLDAGSDQTAVSASQLKLSGLGNFGGPTPTMIPRPGSVAIDVAASCLGVTEDQRHGMRPLDGDNLGGTDCDTGAVEVSFGEDSLLFEDGFESGDVAAWN